MGKRSEENLKNYQKYVRDNISRTNNFITIDPGARIDGGTGLAVTNFKDKAYRSSCTLQGLQDTYEDRVEQICSMLYSYLNQRKDYVVFIEKPMFFDTAIGYAAAKSNSLGKLICLYGRITEIAKHTRSNLVPTVSLEIVHWKGQLSKKQTITRIVNYYPGLKNRDIHHLSGDETDAIGMGLYILGKF